MISPPLNLNFISPILAVPDLDLATSSSEQPQVLLAFLIGVVTHDLVLLVLEAQALCVVVEGPPVESISALSPM